MDAAVTCVDAVVTCVVTYALISAVNVTTLPPLLAEVVTANIEAPTFPTYLSCVLVMLYLQKLHLSQFART